jgi:hypothetical protein
MYAGAVRVWQLASLVVPLVGSVVAVTVPVVRYALIDRSERAAIAALHSIHDAQQMYHRTSGGYAADLRSLTDACVGQPPALAADVLLRLTQAGYALALRASADAAVTGRDCHGRALVSDYYVAAAPAAPGVLPRQAFAGRSDRQLYLFVDGIAPREAEIASGLAIPLAARETFKIP